MHKRILHVTHISSGDLWAGAEMQLYQLLSAPSYSSAVKPRIVLFNEGPLATRTRALGIDVVIIPEASGTTSLLRQLRAELRENAPDILHTHGYKENILGNAAAIGLRLPVSVRTEHGSPEHQFGWRQLHKYLIGALDRWVARHMQKAVIAVSPALKEQLSQLYPGQVHQIVNGIDVEAVQQYALKTVDHGKSPKRIGIVGRLVPVKQMDVFIDTFAQLLDKGYDLEGFVIGDGPLRQELETQAARLGINEKLTFCGFVDPVYPHIAKLDVLMMCSKHEGLPMTLLEAQALEVGIVGHAVGGIPFVLDEGKSGTLVYHQTPEAYVSALETLLAQPDQLRAKTTHGKQRVEQIFSTDKMGTEYTRLYHSLLEVAS